MNIETLAVHAGALSDRTAGSVASPIYPSTTFLREANGEYPDGYIYSRAGNPNRDALQACVASLEGAAAAAAFASGTAAAAAVLQALAPGDHIVVDTDAYYGTTEMLAELFARWGLQHTRVDLADLDALAGAIRPNTRLVWGETPSNPLLKVVDIQAVSAIARQASALSLFDNTVGTPVLQRPLELGADLVLHSATKYLGGHSDLLLGVIAARERSEFFARVETMQKLSGGVPSPFDCWLALRGIATLPYRVRAQSASALQVARFLSAHPRVAHVHYPGLEHHPGHMLAARQMSAFGGLLSIQVVGGAAEALAVAARVSVFTRATSLGAVHSLIEHRASVESPGTLTPPNLLRISVGLEHPDDLIADLATALD